MLHLPQAFGREPDSLWIPAEVWGPEGQSFPRPIGTHSDAPADQVKGYPCRSTPVSLLAGSAVEGTRNHHLATGIQGEGLVDGCRLNEA